jgi:hypothetical protein
LLRVGALGLALLFATVARADDRLERSRAIAAGFQQALGAKLQSALASGGPMKAIEVCREQAPAIAARASAESGAAVGRTALRLRNPASRPDAAATAVLEDFRDRVAAGAQMPVEHFEAHADGSARYLSAIVLQPPCATCHGTVLAAGVAEAIAAHYPDDRATGFRVGELRGAFIIDWPAQAPVSR